MFLGVLLIEIFSGLRKKIFILLSRVPYPLEKGDKLRAYYQIREMSENHDIILCALSDRPIPPEAKEFLQPYTKALYFFRLSRINIFFRLVKNFFSEKPYQVAYFFSKNVSRKIQDLIGIHQPDHLFFQLIRTAEYANGIGIDKTLDYQDVFSKGLERRINISPWYKKPLLRQEYLRVVNYEKKAFEAFEKKVIISHPDRDLIPHEGRDSIEIVPNGVDTHFFHPMDQEKKYDVVFTGNMGYPPNVNGAKYLVNEIMPLVWKQNPEVTVLLAGANPAPGVKALASKKVTVTGWVDDIRDYYAGSKVFIAPMRIGTGLQNKVLEAMAMQLPCITSALANQALKAMPDQEVLIGEEPAQYARHVLSLLNEPGQRVRLAESGYRFVLRNFHWRNVCSQLEKIIIR